MKFRRPTTTKRRRILPLLIIAISIVLILVYLQHHEQQHQQNVATAIAAGMSVVFWQVADALFLAPRLQQGTFVSFLPLDHVFKDTLSGVRVNDTNRKQDDDVTFMDQDGTRDLRSLFRMDVIVEYNDKNKAQQHQDNHAKNVVTANSKHGTTRKDDKTSKNSHIKPLVSSCPYLLNAETQHFRIPNTELHRIEFGDLDKPDRYFNPTFLTLPDRGSAVGRQHSQDGDKSPGGIPSQHPSYEYVVVSRLVTAGLHQETHYCPAVTNRTTQHLQCVLPPRRLRLPPTPAYRCEGRWATIADIPGFHDPRVFWSGMGQPLMIVNSASAMAPNGCVGLWVVDLRAVSEDIDGWLDGEVDSNTQGSSDDTEELDGEVLDKKEIWVRPKMSYPYLTELTKNPPSTRNTIEKNWVLFFPQEDEAWVMYDVIGENEVHVHNEGAARSGKGTAHTSAAAENTSTDTSDIGPNAMHHTSSASTSIMADVRKESNDQSLRKGLPESASASGLNVLWSNKTNIVTRQSSKEKTQKISTLNPARTLAKLLGHGATTPNLTSLHESPCFNDTHVHDKLGNVGKWHQGSNSLRLVLCQHPESTTQRLPGIELCALTNENESLLVKEGRVVHIMILHRKFSNALKLPERYERHFLVWEARNPFKLLGVSKHPLLFEGERAQPWSEEENNLPLEKDPSIEIDAHRMKEREKWENVYFSYTPSLAWASTSWSRTISNRQLQKETDLETAYLDDEIIVGIGMDDKQQGFVKVKAFDLLSCLRLCPDFAEL